MSEKAEQLRKLAPLLQPGEAERLRLGRSSPLTRKHVDQYIATLAEQHLYEAGFREKLLLPPPSPAESSGPIKVGQVWYDGPRGVLGMHRQEFTKHCGVVGSSGSGKTTFAFRVVKELLENDVPVVVFDPKRSWRSALEFTDNSKVQIYTLARPEISPLFWNPLIPPDGVPAELFDSFSTQIGQEVLYGGLGAQAVTADAVKRLRANYPMPAAREDHFTMEDICTKVQEIARRMRGAKRAGDWTATAIRITKELASPPLGRIINVRRNEMEMELDEAQLIVFECDLMSQVQYIYLVTSFLLREYFKRLSTDRPDELERVIVFEEGARVFGMPYPQPTMETVMREIREKGVGMFWITQSAGDVNKTAWANTNTLFVFKQISADDISKVARAVAFERPREKAYCARLRVGEFIARLPDRFLWPFSGRSQDIRKTPVSDERVAALASPLAKAIRNAISKVAPESPFPGDKKEERSSIPVHQPARATMKPRQTSGEVVQFASKAEEYEAAMAQMLTQAAEKPSSPVTYLYSQMGLPKAKGARVADRLVQAGLAEKVRGSVDGHAAVHLRPTEQAASWLLGREHLLSMPLVAWETQRFGGDKSKRLEEAAKRHFRARGWKLLGTEVPDGFGSGRWDMLWARPDGRKVVVELVTGESKAHEAVHVQKAVTKGVPIVVFCASETILQRVQRYLLAANIVPDDQEVTVVAAEEMAS